MTHFVELDVSKYKHDLATLDEREEIIWLKLKINHNLITSGQH